MPFSFEDLEVYRKTLDFCVSVIDVIDQFDLSWKHYKLIEQLELLSTSVALNISEGKGRFSKKEFKQSLCIARGSLYETVSMLKVFKKKHWLDQSQFAKLYSQAEEINRMLSGLIKSIKE